MKLEVKMRYTMICVDLDFGIDAGEIAKDMGKLTDEFAMNGICMQA